MRAPLRDRNAAASLFSATLGGIQKDFGLGFSGLGGPPAFGPVLHTRIKDTTGKRLDNAALGVFKTLLGLLENLDDTSSVAQFRSAVFTSPEDRPRLLPIEETAGFGTLFHLFMDLSRKTEEFEDPGGRNGRIYNKASPLAVVPGSVTMPTVENDEPDPNDDSQTPADVEGKETIYTIQADAVGGVGFPAP